MSSAMSVSSSSSAPVPLSSSLSPPSHFYCVSAQKPTIVSHSVSAPFTVAGVSDLIVARANRLEIYNHDKEAQTLSLRFTVPLFCRVSCLSAFRTRASPLSRLLVVSERGDYFVLEYNSTEEAINTVASGDLRHRIGRRCDSGQVCLVDPRHSSVLVQQYDGILQAAAIDGNKPALDFADYRLEELHVLCLTFLHHQSKPLLCVLYQDPKEKRHIKTYCVDAKDRDIKAGLWAANNVDPTASIIIPVGLSCGGVLCVGEDLVAYYGANATKAGNGGGALRAARLEPTAISAWCAIDGHRYLMGDLAGNLYLLLLQADGKQEQVNGVAIELLGRTSSPSSLSYLDGGLVFVGSVSGDSQLVRLNTEKDDNGSCIDILSVYTNLGSIIDMSVVDLDRQGQVQLVTCSGAFKDGSLRVIRNGIGIVEEASIELPGMKGLWALKASDDTEYDKFLVESFVGETRVLAIEEQELGEIEVPGFDQALPTLLTGNLAGGYFVQVTPVSARLVAAASLQLVDEWRPAGGNITVAHSNGHQVLLATSGSRLSLLCVAAGRLSVVSNVVLDGEVSCLFISNGDYAAVGMWNDLTIRIMHVPTLNERTRERIGGEIIPRSVLVAQLENAGPCVLFCGLGDGSLLNFEFHAHNNTLINRKKLALGAQPISLRLFSSGSSVHVFASCDRPTVISSTDGKLLYSNVNLRHVTCMAPFNTVAFKDCLAFASEEQLVIGHIDAIQKLHIKSIPLNAQPKRLAHQPASKTLGLLMATMERADDGYQAEANAFQLLDDQTFDVLATFPLEPLEAGASIFSMKLDGEDGGDVYVVGTAILRADELEPSGGRLLVFRVQDRQLHLLATQRIKGAPYMLGSVRGRIVAGVNSKVIVFKAISSHEQLKLSVECSHSGNMLVFQLRCQGDYVLVGDMTKSMSLLRFIEATGSTASALEEVAHDIDSNWMTAVAFLNSQVFLGADTSYNLFTMRRHLDAATDEERARLELVGKFHTGEFINTIVEGSLVMNLPDTEAPEQKIVPTHLFGTINGVIGVLAPLNKAQFQFLSSLEELIEGAVRAVGNLSHKQYRAFTNDKRSDTSSVGFVDGDLIELYLDLQPSVQAAIAERAGLPVAELTKRIEELARIH